MLFGHVSGVMVMLFDHVSGVMAFCLTMFQV